MYRIIYEDGMYYAQYRGWVFWYYFEREPCCDACPVEPIKFNFAEQARKYILDYIESEKSEECKSPKEIIEVIKN